MTKQELTKRWRKSPRGKLMEKLYRDKNKRRIQAHIKKWRQSSKGKIWYSKYRQRKRESLRVNSANWRKRHPDKVRENSREMREKYQTEYKARGVLNSAVYSGRIIKPSRCSSCMANCPSHMIHGHHYNGYDNPLDVEWLCSECHGRSHSKIEIEYPE